MYAWILAVSLTVGIVFARYTEISWPYLSVGLAVGVIALFVTQFKQKIHPLLPFIWNVALVGAMWYTLRLQMHERSADDSSSSFVERVAGSAAAVSRQYMMKSGLSQDDVNVLNAMLMGDRKSLLYEQKMRFRNAGAQHLLALSGLHLGIFIGVLSFLFLRRARYTRWRWPVLLAVLSLLWCYCLAAGMPQSLLRAMLMATLYYVCLYLRSYSAPSANLANTAWLMLLIDPASVFDIGTQLSFMAVGAIIWLYPQVSNILPREVFPKSRAGTFLRRLWSLFGVSFSAWIGTFPLCLYYFHQFQPWQPLASLLLIPTTSLLLYVSLILLLTCFLHLWPLSVLLAKGVSWCMLVENRLLDFAGSLPFSTIHCRPIHLGHIVLLYALFFLLWLSLRSTAKVQVYSLLEMLLIIVLLCLV